MSGPVICAEVPGQFPVFLTIQLLIENLLLVQKKVQSIMFFMGALLSVQISIP